MLAIVAIDSFCADEKQSYVKSVVSFEKYRNPSRYPWTIAAGVI
jgi:hypothetical protein